MHLSLELKFLIYSLHGNLSILVSTSKDIFNITSVKTKKKALSKFNITEKNY